jgi:hypothetical protein
MLKNMCEQNPQMRQILTNPAMMQQMMSPENMNAAMSMMQGGGGSGMGAMAGNPAGF